LVRYKVDGSLDATFGVGGRVTTDLGGADSAAALVLQPDAKLVAAGSARSSTTSDFALARYLAGAICGNGVVEPGEQCDDGNTAGGDCCSSGCQFEEGACDDGDACTVGDACQNGACVGEMHDLD